MAKYTDFTKITDLWKSIGASKMEKKYDKGAIMRVAWMLVKQSDALFDDSNPKPPVQDHLSDCLKEAWRGAKEGDVGRDHAKAEKGVNSCQVIR